jgi:tRNA pseudouridine55 synthase
MSAPRRPPRRRIDGVLLLDKPAGLTSNGALMRVKRSYNAEKAGHTGTLDPLASGLLPICFGNATRFAQFLLDARKRYLATVRFVVTTTTLDAEGEVILWRAVEFDRDALVAALSRRVGAGMQTPPMHAALKFEGKPYYEYARRGLDIPRVPRAITIHALRLLDWRPPDATLDVECSKGTYVRVVAADLGEALGCGAHLATLRRTASGGFDVTDAHPVEAIETMSDAERDLCLLPSSVLVAHLPSLQVDGERARRFLHGAALATEEADDGLVAIYDATVLLGVADVVAGFAHPRRVLADSRVG